MRLRQNIEGLDGAAGRHRQKGLGVSAANLFAPERREPGAEIAQAGSYPEAHCLLLRDVMREQAGLFLELVRDVDVVRGCKGEGTVRLNHKDRRVRLQWRGFSR